MSSPIVYVKDPGQRSVQTDLSTSLTTGETVATVVLEGAVVPTTASPLVIGGITTQAAAFTCVMTGGLEGVTYGSKFRVTTSTARIFFVTIAVLIQTNLNVPYVTHNPYAFPTLVGTLEAGDAAAAKAFFVLPALSVDEQAEYSQGYVTWSLVDGEGTVYANGNCYDYQLTPGSMMTTVEANAVVNAPSDIPPTLDNQRYQLRWELNVNGKPSQYAFESIQVTGLASVPLGATDTVELHGDLAEVALVVAKPYTDVGVQVYNGNTLLTPYTPATDKVRVSSGWHYVVGLATENYTPSLDPYVVSWRYSNGTANAVNRETSRLYVINASLLAAIEDVRQQVMKARTTLMGFDDTLFDTTTIISWLRRGRDEFNGAGGYITQFEMTAASGGVREAWLRYAEVAMLRSQYLAEGEKAFNFSGQAISLDVDRTQYYQGLADQLYSTLDSFVPTLKKNLQIKGITGGDGDVMRMGTAYGAMGGVGISWNAVSPSYPNSSFIR